MAKNGIPTQAWPEFGDKVLRLAEVTATEGEIHISGELSPEIQKIIDIYQEFVA